jgi:hypothetical protein
VAEQVGDPRIERRRQLAIGADIGIERFVEQIDDLRLAPQRLERFVDRRQRERGRMNQEDTLRHGLVPPI